MLYVSLIVEILRARPRLIFWLATLAQAAVWTVVPALFFGAPPADVPDILARAHGFRFDLNLGPPLSYWLAELAFMLSGYHLAGIYLLCQICVVVTYWAVFTLGRATVGDRHAVLAVLLMIGISVFTMPTLEFGPAILAMPLWALALLHLWRAFGEERQLYWYALAIDLALLLMTSYLGLVLTALVILYIASSERGRLRFTGPPIIGAVIVAAAFAFNLVMLDKTVSDVLPALHHLRDAESANEYLVTWLRLLGLFALGFAGAAILVALACNLRRAPPSDAALIERKPVDLFTQHFIYFFALLPVVTVTPFAVIAGVSTGMNAAPLFVLAGLAIVLTAGDRIMLHNQSLLGATWLALLLLPPLLAGIAVAVVPWATGQDLKIAQPAVEMGRFFADSFERRTGQRLKIVGGDTNLATLIAIGTPTHPAVIADGKPGQGGGASAKDAAERGAIIVWPATDSAGAPPPDIAARFPDLTPEVPRAFPRTLQGQLPVLRIGWAMLRPQAQPGAAPAQ